MVEYDSDWQSRYSDMITTPKKAVTNVAPGHRVFVGTGCGEPEELVDALTSRAGELADVEIIQLFTKGVAPYAEKSLADRFKVNSFFIGCRPPKADRFKSAPRIYNRCRWLFAETITIRPGAFAAGASWPIANWSAYARWPGPAGPPRHERPP